MTMDLRTYAKMHTTVDPQIIDEIMDQYDERKNSSDIYLNVETLGSRLRTSKSELIRIIRKKFKPNIDYTEEEIVTRAGMHIKFLITPDVYKFMCLRSQTALGDKMRSYFIEIEKAFFRYKDYVIEGLKREREALLRNQRPHPEYPVRDTIYVFTVPDEVVVGENGRPLVRFGRTNNLNKRMLSHNSPLANDIKILAEIPVKDVAKVESCMKLFLKDFQYRRGKEVYDISEADIKKMFDVCEKGSLVAARLAKKVHKAIQGGQRIYASRHPPLFHPRAKKPKTSGKKTVRQHRAA